MPIPELGKLERVPVRQIWSHEEYEFTPWLVENLDLLSETLEIPLDDPKREAWLPGAGEVDILAKVRSSEDEEAETVVIENQLEISDESHFRRLLGYAVSRDASILIWVAGEFTPNYIKLIDWLNRRSGNGIAIYCVQVSGWRIGEAKAPRFDVVAAPSLGMQRASSRPTAPNKFGDFFRPLTDRLRGVGIRAIGGRQGGWVGSSRTFRTGHEDQGMRYVLTLGFGGMAWACLLLGRDAPNRESIWTALREFQAEMPSDIALADTEIWEKDGYPFVIGLSTEASFDDPAEKLESTRDWMFDNLLKLKEVIQPRLDKVMAELQPAAATDDDVPTTHDDPETTE